MATTEEAGSSSSSAKRKLEDTEEDENAKKIGRSSEETPLAVPTDRPDEGKASSSNTNGAAEQNEESLNEAKDDPKNEIKDDTEVKPETIAKEDDTTTEATSKEKDSNGSIVETSQTQAMSGETDESSAVAPSSIPKKSTIDSTPSVDPTTVNDSTTATATAITTDPTSITVNESTTAVMPNTTTNYIDPDEMIEENGSLLPEYVGRVIGKGGEMIRDLQARSGCKIDVDQNVPQGAPRIISYKGKRSKVEFAKHLVHLLSVQNVGEDDLPLGDAKEEVLAVPATVVGKVIGRGTYLRVRSTYTHAMKEVK